MPGTAWGLALAAAFFFGFALVLTPFGLRHMSATQGAVVSIPSSTALFWVLAPFTVTATEWEATAAAVFVVVGLLFPATVTLLTFEANRRMGPNVTAATGNLAPLFAVLFAVVALGESLDLSQGVGIAVIVVGVTALSTDRRGTAAAWPVWALALPLAAAVIRGGVQPAIKAGLAIWSSPFAAALIGYTVSSLVVIAFAVWRARGLPRGVNRAGGAWFAGVGVSNGLAVFLTYAALARGPVTLVSPLVASYPLVTLVLSGLLLRRTVRISGRMVLGVLATVAGVALLLSA